MPMEVAHEGVTDAVTGEFLAGAVGDSLKGSDGPVLARIVGETWELVSEDESPLASVNDGAVRKVVVVSTSHRRTAKSEDTGKAS